MPKRFLKKTIFLLFGLYITGGFILYFFQKPIFFHATKLSNNYTFQFKQPFKDTTILVNHSLTNIVHFYPNQKPKGVVLYCHGNQTNITRYAPYAPLFTNLGYEVIMYDYPTYGKSTGELAEQNLYIQAQVVYNYTKQFYADSNIVIYGKSIGTGIANYLAGNNPCKHLILETPYYSLLQVAKQWAWMYPCNKLMQFQIPAYQFIKKCKSPITIFHGTKDGTIHLQTALQLKPFLKPSDTFLIIANGKHNNLPQHHLYNQKIKQILSN